MKSDWQQRLAAEMERESYRELWRFLEEEYATATVYPPREQVFAALAHTGYRETSVLILGQDPYHGPGQAHGLSFSVAGEDAKFPPSLRNLFKELEADTGLRRTRRDLTDWADQGVLLLNTVLTVRAGEAASHRGKGWEAFTDAVITALNQRQEPVIFVLWGGDAKKKLPLITGEAHRVLTAAHPSPLSAHNGFFGSRPFSQINEQLRRWGRPEIRWA